MYFSVLDVQIIHVNFQVYMNYVMIKHLNFPTNFKFILWLKLDYGVLPLDRTTFVVLEATDFPLRCCNGAHMATFAVF